MDNEIQTTETKILKKKTGRPNKKTNVIITDKLAVTPIQPTLIKDTIEVRFKF